LLSRLPEGLCALQELDVSYCQALAEDWLPACSAAHVRRLSVAATSIRRLPEGLCALHALDVTSCTALAEDWLPASIAAGMRTLRAQFTNLAHLRQGLPAHVQLTSDRFRAVARL
jgi:hypothetical protein